MVKHELLTQSDKSTFFPAKIKMFASKGSEVTDLFGFASRRSIVTT